MMTYQMLRGVVFVAALAIVGGAAVAQAGPCKADGTTCTQAKSCCGTNGRNGTCVTSGRAKFGTCCTATNGGLEICDGLDNDCNGTIDDGGDALCDLGLCETIEVCNGASGCESMRDPN